MKRATIVVIDGQGGGIGAQLIEGIRQGAPGAGILAVGTNSVATSAMLRAGAARGATGENAVVVNSRNADVIVGPIGIVVADSMLGEISAAMAAAVGRSAARKLLIPINLCNNVVVGASAIPIKELIAQAVAEVRRYCAELEGNG